MNLRREIDLWVLLDFFDYLHMLTLLCSDRWMFGIIRNVGNRWFFLDLLGRDGELIKLRCSTLLRGLVALGVAGLQLLPFVSVLAVYSLDRCAKDLRILIGCFCQRVLTVEIYVDWSVRSR